MGKSRRERSKAEGTFLEVVKHHMELVSEELRNIGIVLNDLKSAQTTLHSLCYDPFIAHGCEGDAYLGEIGFATGQNFCSKQPADFQDEGVSCWTSPTAWYALEENLVGATLCDRKLNANAKVFEPAPVDPIHSRDKLLMHRVIDVDNTYFEDGSRISVQVIDNIAGRHAPKLWSRRRPSAKVRRARRLAAIPHHSTEGNEEVVELSSDGPGHDWTIPTQRDIENVSLHSDDREMVLPVSSLSYLDRSSQSFPLRLQRDVFFAYLPANAELLATIELGFDAGSAYRCDWQENPMAATKTTDYNDIQSDVPPYWGQTEIETWVRVTIRMAASRKTVSERTSFILGRWDSASQHISPDKLSDMQTIVNEVIDVAKGWPVEDAIT